MLRAHLPVGSPRDARGKVTNAHRLLAFLKIQPDEAGLAVLVALFFGLVDLGRAVGDSTADALFLRRYGVENLPYMFIGLGILTFLVSLGFAALVSRLEKRRFFPSLLLGMAILLLGERAAISLNLRELYPVLWLTINVIATLLGILAWTTAGEVCDTRQAKRLFPIFVTASILGGLLGGFLIGPVARLLGTENLVIVYSLLLAGAALLTRTIAQRFFKQSEPAQPASTFLTDIQAGFNYVRRAPLLQLLAISAILFSILYFSVSFPFSRAVAAAYQDEASLAGFLGMFKGVSGAIMFVAALLIANRLYARIGIVYALLILPITYLAGFILFAVNFSLTSAVIVRLSQLTVLSGIGDGAYGAFFNVVPPGRRAQVRAFDAGVPSQIGTILSGVLLLLGERLLSNTTVFAMGMAAAVLCGWVIWRMRPRYGEALLAALRAGRLDVFAGGDKIFAGIAGDLGAQQILASALDGPNPVHQRLAADILARSGGLAAAPALIERLPKANPEVRAAFLRALGQLGDPKAVQPVAMCLDDPAPAVRMAALEALPALGPADRHDVVECIRQRLHDPDLTVCIRASVSLAQCGDAEGACATLLEILHSARDEVSRAHALRAFGPVFAAGQTHPGRPVSEAMETAIGCLKDESPVVRLAACQSLAGVAESQALADVAGLLDDPIPEVRAAAARSLRSAVPVSLPFVLTRLPSTSYPEDVLDALPPEDLSCVEPLRNYAQIELARLRVWREAVRNLPQPGPAASFLSAILASRADRCTNNLVRVIGLLGNDRAMAVVAQALKTHNSEDRAIALEALDTLGDRQIVRDLLILLEEAHTPDGHQENAAPVLRPLLANEKGWMRALVVRSAEELGLVDLTDGDPFAKPGRFAHEAGGVSLRQPGGTMDTLPTISLVERTLLLREIPLFSDLSADDLVQVAQTAGERWFEDGQVLCRQGEIGQELFVIASGEVRVAKREQGQERQLAVRKAGEFIGEMSIIESAPRLAMVTAQGEVRALVITAAAFKAILLERPEVAMAVMRGLSHRLRECS